MAYTETAITGNGKFISLQSKTNNTPQVSDGSNNLKTVTASEWNKNDFKQSFVFYKYDLKSRYL